MALDRLDLLDGVGEGFLELFLELECDGAGEGFLELFFEFIGDAFLEFGLDDTGVFPRLLEGVLCLLLANEALRC